MNDPNAPIAPNEQQPTPEAHPPHGDPPAPQSTDAPNASPQGLAVAEVASPVDPSSPTYVLNRIEDIVNHMGMVVMQVVEAAGKTEIEKVQKQSERDIKIAQIEQETHKYEAEIGVRLAEKELDLDEGFSSRMHNTVRGSGFLILLAIVVLTILNKDEAAFRILGSVGLILGGGGLVTIFQKQREQREQQRKARLGEGTPKPPTGP